MKKSLFLFLATICMFGLSGCFLHDEKTVFSEIRFYDLEGNEIIGEYKNYFDDYFDNTSLRLSSELVPLNDPAPIYNFYCATIEDGTSIEVVMKFKKPIRDDLVALNLVCQNDLLNTLQLTENFEEVDEYIFVTFIIENITKDNNLYEVTKWTDQDGEAHYFSPLDGRTYIRGFYLTLNSQIIPS